MLVDPQIARQALRVPQLRQHQRIVTHTHIRRIDRSCHHPKNGHGRGISHHRWWRNGGENPTPTTTYPNYTPPDLDFFGGARWNRTTDLSIISAAL